MSALAKIVVGAAAAALVVYAFLVLDVGRKPEATDFASCVAAGYPVMESYPRQCRDGEGNLYVEETEAPDPSSMVRPDLEEGSLVSSPATFTGEARGMWYFEASFPIQVFDSRGTMLGQGPAQAQGEWMTTEFVPFSATISFATSTTATGTVRFKNDNPSGLPENDAWIDVPVRFAPAGTAAAASPAACRKTGCSGQICSDQDVVSTCEYREEYGCYQTARCERQASGQCGWTQTAALAACLSAAR